MTPKWSVAVCTVIILSGATTAWATAEPASSVAGSPTVAGRDHLPVPSTRPSESDAGDDLGNQTDQQALTTAREQSPELFASEPTEALIVPAGGKVEKYLDDFSARIDITGQKADVIAQSTTPLRVQDNGVNKPVDLKLVATGDTIEPKIPVVPLSFAETLGGGMTIAENIRVHVVGADGDADAQVMGQQVFYANALEDADVLAMPLPAGLETFVQLRSVDSPHTITYRFDLPHGAELVRQQDGAVIVRGTNVLATISTPVSVAADDTLVPTTMRVDGDRLVLDVAVNSATAMPVLVDPTITDNQFVGGDYSSTNGAFQNTYGWRREASGPLANFSFSPNYDNASAGGPCVRLAGSGWQTVQQQLCVQTQSSRNYGGEIGQWKWRPPAGTRTSSDDGAGIATDAYVYEAYVRHSFIRASTSTNAFMYAGIQSGRTGGWLGYSADVAQSGAQSDIRYGYWSWGENNAGVLSNPSFLRHYCAAPSCAIDHANEDVFDGAAFTFGTFARSTGNSLSANAQGAIFYQYDRKSPTVTHGAITDLAPWKRTGSVTTHVTGTDTGMGMHKVGVSYVDKNGGTSTINDIYNCTGGVNLPCPTTMPRSFAVNVDNLPEGNARIDSYAIDVLGKPTPGAGLAVKVDRQGPDLAVGGDLYDGRAQPFKGATYDVWADARDGSLAAPRSGVKSIELKVDHQRVGYCEGNACRTEEQDTGDCVGSDCEDPLPDECANCDLEHLWTVDITHYSSGVHPVEMIATDYADNTSTVTWDATLQPNTAPAPTVEPDPEPTPQGPPPEVSPENRCDPLAVLTTPLAGIVRIVNTITSALRATTVFHDDNSYTVTKCNADGTLDISQDVAPFDTTSGGIIYAPVRSTTRTAATGGSIAVNVPSYGSFEAADGVADSDGTLVLAGALMPAQTVTSVFGSTGSQPRAAAPPACSDRRFRASKARFYQSPPNDNDLRRTVSYRINMNSMPSGVSHSSMAARIVDGHAAWNRIRTTCTNYPHSAGDPPNFTWRRDNRSTKLLAGVSDGISVVDFKAGRLPCGRGNASGAVLACTSYAVPDSGKKIINDADTRFRSDAPWWTSRSTDVSRRSCSAGSELDFNSVECYDLWSVAAHETGHALGLEHVGSPDRPSTLTMYGASHSLATTARTLGLGDVLGLQAQYPLGS